MLNSFPYDILLDVKKNNETENLWLTNNLFRVNSLGTGEMAQ